MNNLWDYCFSTGWEDIKDSNYISKGSFNIRYSNGYLLNKGYGDSCSEIYLIDDDLPLANQIKLLNCFMEVYSNE